MEIKNMFEDDELAIREWFNRWASMMFQLTGAQAKINAGKGNSCRAGNKCR
jgi:hypothetical protein